MINASILDGMSILNKRMEYTYERMNEETNQPRYICAKGYGYPLLYEYRNRVDTMSPHIQTYTQTHPTPHTIAKTEIAIYTMPMSIAMLWL